jgi:very-short-patch-repair endonuclease
MEDKIQQLTWESLSRIIGEEAMLKVKARSELETNVAGSKNYYEKLLAIKDYYISQENNILNAFNKSKLLWATSYPVDWSTLFTPIEYMAWATIRNKGRIVLYPQYPILNFHVDFANPGLKIALEVDGQLYHNPEKDLIRDKQIRNIGWSIYRITGKEMVNIKFKDWQSINDEEIDDNDEKISLIHDWLMNSGDGIIEAIKTIYFIDDYSRFSKTMVGEWFITYCHETLRSH